MGRQTLPCHQYVLVSFSIGKTLAIEYVSISSKIINKVKMATLSSHNSEAYIFPESSKVFQLHIIQSSAITPVASALPPPNSTCSGWEWKKSLPCVWNHCEHLHYPFPAIYVTTIIYYYCEHGRNAIVPAYFSPETKDTTPKRHFPALLSLPQTMFSSISPLVKSHHHCHSVSQTNMLTFSNATTKQDDTQQRRLFSWTNSTMKRAILGF